jgi:hypothetical protein
MIFIPIFEHFFDRGQPAQKSAPPGWAAQVSCFGMPMLSRHHLMLLTFCLLGILTQRC